MVGSGRVGSGRGSSGRNDAQLGMAAGGRRPLYVRTRLEAGLKKKGGLGPLKSLQS
jgi:hypothetical protein